MSQETSSLVFLHYLTTVFDNIKDAILLIGVEPDNKYRLLLANKVFTKISGFPASSIGKEIAEIVGQEGYAFLVKKYQQVIKTKKSVEYMSWSDVPAGRMAFEVQLIPIFSTVGECAQIIVITRDVTEREKLREEVRHLRQTPAANPATLTSA
jgi:PAS domain S-box-containing protein